GVGSDTKRHLESPLNQRCGGPAFRGPRASRMVAMGSDRPREPVRAGTYRGRPAATRQRSRQGISTPLGMSESTEHRERAFAWRPVVLIAAAVVLLLLAVAGRYGYHRDELYFLACGRRLAWGFVDQPPMTPALARLSDGLFPGSLVGLRIWSAMTAGALVVLAGLTARELGAGRRGQ